MESSVGPWHHCVAVGDNARAGIRKASRELFGQFHYSFVLAVLHVQMYFVSVKPHAPSDGGNEFKNIISNVLHVDEVPKPFHKIMETDSTHVKRDTRDSP